MRSKHINCSCGTTKWLLATLVALMAAAAVVAGSAAPPAGAHTLRSAFVPASLLAKAQRHPAGLFKVIVEGPSGGVAAAIRAERLADPGRAAGLKRRLVTVQGASAELNGSQLVGLARMQGISAIIPDAPMQLAGVLSNMQQWPSVTGVLKAWPDVTHGSFPQTPAIAVVDSGVDASRADFEGRVIKQVTLTSLPGNSPGDGRGHGTFVAGIAAGSATSYTGAAPSAKIVSLDVMNDQGMALTSDVIAAADWIYQNKATYNIRVANFSLHSTAPASVFWDPLDRAVEKLWLSGVVVVAAAGNYGVDGQPSGVPYAPGNDPFVITVGATDIGTLNGAGDDSVAPWSAYGYTPDGFSKPDLGAPGRFLVGPVPSGASLPLARPDKVTAPGYMQLSGTSFAAPFVAATAATLRAQNPAWTPDQVKGALMLSAQREPIANRAVGVGDVNISAARAVTAAPPNPNGALDHYLTTGADGATVFDATAWQSAAIASPTWDAAAWSDAAWSSAAWSSAAWSDAAWSDAAWASAAWGTAAWSDAAWSSAAWSDAAWADSFAP